MNYDFIKECFIKKHEVNDFEYLNKYLNFLLNYKLNEDNIEYTEKHHILPISQFPEYKDCDWNLISLLYEDHVHAHLWLFKAINIRSYQKPLNFMMKTYKNSQEVSNASKKGWEKLKNNEEVYKKWRETRSNYMKSLSSEEQSRRANIFWNNITDEEYKDFCKKVSDIWTKERRDNNSKKLKEYYENPENRLKKSVESKEVWDSRSETVRSDFRKKMSEINKNEKKRLDASEKIKKLWNNPKFREKMMNRNTNPGKSFKIIKKDGSTFIVNKMSKLSEEFNISKHKIRKYRDSGLEIQEKDLKENKTLLGCKIESIN